jgi:eukaryotic-like serine/threonine-protein kinase
LALTLGTRLGVYEIITQIGAGGMGEVYRATDSNLKRLVAIKVLPASVAGDADRLARLQREAEVLAALNHPNVAAIYGLERSVDTTALVMELVEGEDLSQRIERGAIPLDEALLIAKQIADALEAAHEQGIIHRDLKPANIKVRSDGTVKVLDFGLAKAMGPGAGSSPSLSMSPTLTTPAMTQAGLILGTAAYMAPEKARGKTVDKRADIWAFGAVLYEMLTARRLFAGDSVAETIGLVVTREPDWSALPAGTPTRITSLLRRCLTREPHNRLRDIGEARIALARTDESPQTSAAPPVPGRRRTVVVAAATAAAFVLGATGAALVLRRAQASSSAPLRRFELPAAVAAASIGPVLSRDGSHLAVVAGNHLRVQALDALESQDLGPVPVSTANLFWSPDGTSIGFIADATVQTVPTSGGAPFSVCRIPASGRALAVLWRADGTIFMAVWRDSIYKVPSTGGTPEIFLRMNPVTEVDFHAISEVPGNRFIVETHVREVAPEHPDADRVQQELYDGNRRTVLTSALNVENFAYAPPRNLLFMRTDANRGVWAIPFSEGPLDLSKAVRIEAGATRFSAADDGTLIASIRPSAPSKAEIVWVDRRGTMTAVPGAPLDLAETPAPNLALSPDGRRAAFVAGEPSSVFVRDLASGVDTRLTFERHRYDTPTWFPTGDQVLYLSDIAMTRATAPRVAGTSFLGAVMAQRADGTDRPRELTSATAVPRVAPDGKSLLFIVDDTGRGRLRISPIGPDRSIGPAQRFFRDGDEPNVRSIDLSRDGRLLAYVAEDQSRRFDIFLTEFPSANGRWQVRTGGNLPQFSPAGGELFFLSGTVTVTGEARGQFDVVPITANPAVAVGQETKLFDLNAPGSPHPGAMGYSVAADGRILSARVLKRDGQARRIVLVQNWTALLKSNR